MTEPGFRSGYVALIGRPNVGKSTLLNRWIGQKIAATTHKPQTTRKKLLGIVELPGAQLLLLDTPGYHRAKGLLNRFMVSEARSAIEDADLIAYLIEARGDAAITPGNEFLISELLRIRKPVLLLVNKIDELPDKEQLLPLLEVYAKRLGDLLTEAVPISALKGAGVDRAMKAIAERLPEGPRYYEEGQLTDQSEREIVAEMIREKIILETRDELPYAAAVVVDEFEEEDREGGARFARIHATIFLERDSQKGIVIGRGGERLKSIGTRARKDIEYFLDARVYLELQVKVSERWSDDPVKLARLGYSAEQGARLPQLDEPADAPDDEEP